MNKLCYGPPWPRYCNIRNVKNFGYKNCHFPAAYQHFRVTLATLWNAWLHLLYHSKSLFFECYQTRGAINCFHSFTLGLAELGKKKHPAQINTESNQVSRRTSPPPSARLSPGPTSLTSQPVAPWTINDRLIGQKISTLPQKQPSSQNDYNQVGIKKQMGLGLPLLRNPPSIAIFVSVSIDWSITVVKKLIFDLEDLSAWVWRSRNHRQCPVVVSLFTITFGSSPLGLFCSAHGICHAGQFERDSNAQTKGNGRTASTLCWRNGRGLETRGNGGEETDERREKNS